MHSQSGPKGEEPAGTKKVQLNIFKQLDTDGSGDLSQEEDLVFFIKRGIKVPEGHWEDHDQNKDGEHPISSAHTNDDTCGNTHAFDIFDGGHH